MTLSHFMPGQIPAPVCSGRVNPVFCCMCHSSRCLHWAEMAAVDTGIDHSVCMAYFTKGDRRFTAIGTMAICPRCRADTTNDRISYFAHWHGETITDIPAAIRTVQKDESIEIIGGIARALYQQIHKNGYNLLTGRIMAAADIIRYRQHGRHYIMSRIKETTEAGTSDQAWHPTADYYRGYLEMLNSFMED